MENVPARDSTTLATGVVGLAGCALGSWRSVGVGRREQRAGGPRERAARGMSQRGQSVQVRGSGREWRNVTLGVGLW